MRAAADGDLRKVRDGDDLMRPADLSQLVADGVGDFAADVGVDFVKDEQGNPVVARQYGFDGEHNA